MFHNIQKEKVMPKTPGANLYKDASLWPVIPPWWLLSSPQAAALINVAPATLQYWRTRGEWPAAVAPMLLKPAQGDPVFFVYGTLRSWAAERVGIKYLFEDQCHDFFAEVMPPMNSTYGSVVARAEMFDRILESGRRHVRLGQPPGLISKERILALEAFFAKQPKWRRQEAKYDWALPAAA